MEDEIWTTRDGRKIPVGELTEEHARNILRMLIRKGRDLRDRRMIEMIAKEDIPDCWFERPDNHAVLADLRRKHGDAVRVERAGVAGMDGGNVYIGDTHAGWFGGI